MSHYTQQFSFLIDRTSAYDRLSIETTTFSCETAMQFVRMIDATPVSCQFNKLSSFLTILGLDNTTVALSGMSSNTTQFVPIFTLFPI